MYFEENFKHRKLLSARMRDVYQQSLIDYARELDYKFLDKVGHYLFFIDVSGCPFSCQEIAYINLNMGFDGYVRRILKDEVNRVPAKILAKFKRAFKKRYGFEWDANMDVDVFADKVCKHEDSIPPKEWLENKFA